MSTSRPRAVLLSATRILPLVLTLAFDPAPAALAQVWTPLSPTGPNPVARRLEAMVVDEVGARLVVVGGEHGDASTWALSLVGPTVWTNLNAAAPAGASDVVQAIYDPQGRRMVLVMPNCAVWTLDLANPTSWQMLIAEGTGPPPRRYPVIVHDAARNRLILFGGGPDTGTWSDVWALNLSGSPAWQAITPSGPGPLARWAAVGVYDSSGDRLVVCSGSTTQGLGNDVWALSLSNPTSWVELHPSGLLPQARYLSAAIFDPVTTELILFDGHNGSNGLNDLWTLDLSDPTSWTRLLPSGLTPSFRWSHRATYHAGGAAMVTYGGWDESNYRSDPWTFSRPAPGGEPRIFGFSPTGGKIGDEVTIFGLSLENPSEVTIGGAVAPVLTSSAGSIQAVVPAGAVTGPITVTTAGGTAVSQDEFFVGEAPVIERALPDSARAGETVELRGSAFATTSRVSFGGATPVTFTVLSDTAIAATLDTLSTSGPIHVTTRVGTSQSAFTFHVIADDPRPRLLSVRDVQGDQGGRVMLRWRASDFDQFRYRSITGYRVWRRAPLEGLSTQAAAASGWRSSRALGQAAAAPDAFWESVAELPATFLAGYAYAASTLQDSTELGNPYTAFFVQALTKDVFKFYNSNPDSGYSVDNLAPPTPAPFAVEYQLSGNTLHWRGRAVSDLRGYQIHRGGSSAFLPDASTLVATVNDTTFSDIGGSHYYKLAAIDVHGNRSRFASASPDRPVATIVAFLKAERDKGRVRMTWFSGGNAGMPAEVFRRTEGSDWTLQRKIHADGTGFLRYDDGAVEDGERYGYRLSIQDGDGELLTLGEAWVDPLVTAFAWAAPTENPSFGGRVRLALDVPSGVRAVVRLYDVSGRQVDVAESAAGGAGTRSIEFGSSARLRPGIYLIRATLGATQLTRRVAVLD